MTDEIGNLDGEKSSNTLDQLQKVFIGIISHELITIRSLSKLNQNPERVSLFLQNKNCRIGQGISALSDGDALFLVRV